MLFAAHALAHGSGWGPGPWWPVFPILWLLFFGTVIFFVIRSRRNWAAWRPGHSPEAVLGERYARGEISEDEYRERLAVLKRSR